MNLKINSEQMKELTWGHELEMSNMNCIHAITIVKNYYHDKYGCENAIREGGDWEHRYTFNDGKHRGKWAVHVDSSVHLSGEGSCELVTPIMKYEDIEDMQAIIRKLREEGARSGQRYGCGAHIHIGADLGQENGQNAHSLRNLINIMASHEELLFKACGISSDRYNGGYCKKLPRQMVDKLNRVKPRSVDGVRAIFNEYCNRYQTLNYDSLTDNGTTEFRLWEYHNNMHAGEFKSWLQLSLAMANYAKVVRHCTSRPIDITNEKHAMRQWLNNLGLIGEEFKTCRKLMLKRLDGDSAYLHTRASNSNNTDDLDVSIN